MEDVGKYFGDIWSILWPFVILCSNLVHFPCWYIVPRRIWQPCWRLFDSFNLEQGDQIGLIFANFAIAYFTGPFLENNKIRNRVNRMGEFSHIGQLFTLLGSLKNSTSPRLWIIFFHGLSYVLITSKNWSAFIFGVFSHKLIWSPRFWTKDSSWHPPWKTFLQDKKFSSDSQQGCQIFLDTIYQNGENVPSDPKLYQKAVKYSEWS
jgi:hypothetical protein